MDKHKKAAPGWTPGSGCMTPSDAFDSKPPSAPLATPPAREHFSISRASEYFTARELEIMTGCPVAAFAQSGAPKELIDNALDAAEAAGRAPVIAIAAAFADNRLTLTVTDNGNGIPAAIVARVLDFASRTSDKAAYRGPARGAQGNALKTIIGLPVAMGDPRADLVIITQGIAHRIGAWLDPSQAVRIEHATDPAPEAIGTAITLNLPDATADVASALDSIAFAFHALNPHASVNIAISGTTIEHGKPDPVAIRHLYQPTDPTWSKYRSSDPESAHWHDRDSFARLVQLTINAGDRTLRDFVRSFRGLTATAKAKAICAELPWQRLSELDGNTEAAARLLIALKRQAAPPPPASLGIIGENHLSRALAARYDLVEGRQWYKRALASRAFAEVTARRPIRLRPERLTRALKAAFTPESPHRPEPWRDPLTRRVARHFASAALERPIKAAVSAAIKRAHRISEGRART